MSKHKKFIKRDGVLVSNSATGIRSLSAIGGWFYENPKSIDVYAQSPLGGVVSVRITRAQLADWLGRTAAKRKPKP